MFGHDDKKRSVEREGAKNIMAFSQMSLNEKEFVAQANKRNNIYLPEPTLPFNPKPTLRDDLKPIGAKPISQCLEEERYLHSILNRIAKSNSHLFTGKIDANAFRFVYEPQLKGTAKVDKHRLVIAVSGKFFKRVNSDAHVAAIICHEVSHIIRGHLDFGQLPPRVLSHPRYEEQTKRLERARGNLKPEQTAQIFSNFDQCSRALKNRIEIKKPGALDYLEQKWKRASGHDAREIRQEMNRYLESFARFDSSQESKNYLLGLKAERDYQKKLEYFQEILEIREKVADKILGEKGASRNWTEQEADELGLRLFIRAGFHPKDFLGVLVQTLDNNSGELATYLKELNAVEDPTRFRFPERGSENHPSPKWRMANIAIRELRLRYPNEYKSLSESAENMKGNFYSPYGKWLEKIKARM